MPWDDDRVRRGNQLLKWLLGLAVKAGTAEYGYVKILVGEHEFVERRSQYPSERLIADLALAIGALGGFDFSDVIVDFDPETVEGVLMRSNRMLAEANLRAWEDMTTPRDVFLFMGERMP